MSNRIVLLLIGVLVLTVAGAAGVGYLVLMRQPDGKQPQPDGPAVKIVGAGGSEVVLEAESAEKLSQPFVVKADASGPAGKAAGGKCIYIGPEKWNEKWKAGQVTCDCEKGHPEAPFPGFARYTFTVPKTGDYSLWLRAYWVDDCGDSVQVLLDGNTRRDLGGSTHGQWTWNPLRNIENDLERIHLEEGTTHTLTILNREDDAYIDQILLRSMDRTWPDPIGILKTDAGASPKDHP